jgi:outer membrane protein assembly factor BamB
LRFSWKTPLARACTACLLASPACSRAAAAPAIDEPAPLPAAELRSLGLAGPSSSSPLPAPAPKCTSDPWTTYGHDSARTSASGGCVSGPLHVAWTFSPHCRTGCPSRVTRAIAEADAVYAAGGFSWEPALWRLDARSGSLVWTYSTGGDSVRDGWPTLAPGRVMLVDDGIFTVDRATGRGHRGELDSWGESVTDGERLYAENTWYLDGYGLYVSAFDLEASLIWRRDYNALARGVMVPDVGGLALDGGLLVHSAQHGPLRDSRLNAFEPKSGERRWRVDVSPESSPSIADGRVVTVERWPGEHADKLAARSLDAGVVLWAHELDDARGPAPVQAGRLVLVHTRAGVVAFDRTSGERVWESVVPRTAQAIQSATTMAAATGSGTLVVLSGARVVVLRLDDGAQVWSGEPVAHARKLEAPAIVGDALYVVADGTLARLEGT